MTYTNSEEEKLRPVGFACAYIAYHKICLHIEASFLRYIISPRDGNIEMQTKNIALSSEICSIFTSPTNPSSKVCKQTNDKRIKLLRLQETIQIYINKQLLTLLISISDNLNILSRKKTVNNAAVRNLSHWFTSSIMYTDKGPA